MQRVPGVRMAPCRGLVRSLCAAGPISPSHRQRLPALDLAGAGSALFAVEERHEIGESEMSTADPPRITSGSVPAEVQHS